MDNKMKFSDLIKKIAHETGASEILVHDLLLETVRLGKEDLEAEGRASFPGLGHFRLRWHEQRLGRNPQTGEEIVIAAHNGIQYKTEAGLRRYINRKYAHLKAEILEDEADVVNMPASFPISRATTQPAPVTVESGASSKNRNRYWLWLFAVPVLLIIILLFGPGQRKTETPVLESVPAEMADAAAETETVQEAPAETQEPVEAIKPGVETPVAKAQPPNVQASQHKVEYGQCLWTLSEDYYQQGEFWPNIYRANLNHIENPDLIIAGSDLLVPALEGQPGHRTEKDMEDIATGYMEVYLSCKKFGRPDAIAYLAVVCKWEAKAVLDRYKDKIIAEDLAMAGR